MSNLHHSVVIKFLGTAVPSESLSNPDFSIAQMRQQMCLWLVEGSFVPPCCTLHSAGQREGQNVSGEQA